MKDIEVLSIQCEYSTEFGSFYVFYNAIFLSLHIKSFMEMKIGKLL